MSSPEHLADRRLETLVTKYSRLIRSAVCRVAVTLPATTVDDIEQKVLIALWKAMGDEQIPAHPSSYLYRAAVRETVRTVKARHKAAETDLNVHYLDPQPSPEKLAESAELGAAIDDALETLSPDRQRAVRAHLLGYEVKEIMSMHGWPYNKARNLIARGMADLRRKLVSRGIHV